MKSLSCRASLAVALSLTLAGAAAAQSIPRLQFEKYSLPNGLEIILHEDHSVPLVTVNTWFHVGSGDELPGRTGFAHLFEHLMFIGPQHVPVGIVQSVGRRRTEPESST